MTQLPAIVLVDLVVQLMRKLLALDQASRVTGWAVFNDTQLVDHGHFSVDDDDIGLRLRKIRDKVAQLIADYDINEVAFEDIQMQGNVVNNVQTFKILAEVFGVVYELVTELEIPSTAVLAGTWKSTLGIKGRVRADQKRAAQEYVASTFGVKAIQDECDAICIGAHMTTQHKIPVDDFNWE